MSGRRRHPPSAKALFRATKPKRAEASATLPFDLPEQRAPEPPRRERDYYPTGSPEAVQALISRDGGDIRRLAPGGAVWEPACGDGAMVRPLRAAGFEVIATDIVDRGCPGATVQNFYGADRALAGAIVTNPPFCEINAWDGHGRWLRHALDLEGWRYIAFLLSWDWPAARANGLGALLDARPFAYCYLLRWKLDFTGEGSPPQRNAWFCWRADWQGPPEFRWLDREDARQGRLLPPLDRAPRDA